MKIAATIAGGLLGLVFIAFPIMFFLGMMPKPDFDPTSPAGHFMQAFVPTGYIYLVETLELIGGLLVVVPKTRNLGLLVLGPIIINIVAFHLLILQAGLFPVPFVVGLLALFLLWCERRSFAALIH